MRTVKKTYNRNLSFILSVIFVAAVCLFMKVNVYASEADITVTAGTGEVISGETVTVKVSLNNDDGIAYSKFNLIYDQKVFTYEGGDAQGSGYSGVIPFEVMGSTEEETHYEWTMTFKAADTGTCDFTIEGIKFINTDVEEFSPVINNACVKVSAPGSDDATLSSIIVSGGYLTPDFAKWTLDYICYIDYSVTSVDISAISSQGGRVEIHGSTEDLQPGSNYISIISYAPNGKSMTYNINFYRLDPPTEPPAEPVTEAPTEPETQDIPTEPPTEAPDDVEIVIDEVRYCIVSDFDASIIPRIFYATVEEYKGHDVVVLKNDKYDITLMYLEDENKNGGFYIYDDEEFYEYTVISTPENTYFIYDSRKASDKPDGTETIIEVQNKNIKGYIDSDNKDFCYFYAMNSDKVFNWYCYDYIEKTIQRMHFPDIEREEETPAESYEDVSDADNTVSDNESSKGISFSFRDIILIAGIVLILITVTLIVILVNKKNKDKPEHTENNY